jgi:hypothetical protein
MTHHWVLGGEVFKAELGGNEKGARRERDGSETGLKEKGQTGGQVGRSILSKLCTCRLII